MIKRLIRGKCVILYFDVAYRNLVQELRDDLTGMADHDDKTRHSQRCQQRSLRYAVA